MSKLLIASGNGKLYLFDSAKNEINTVYTNPNANEWFMGLSKHKDHIIVSSTFGVHLFRWYKKELKCVATISNYENMNPRFQHIRTIGDIILAPTLTSNSIFIVGIEGTKFKTIGAVKIARTLERTFFDSISDIVFDQGKIYVLLRRLADNPTTSRIIELSNSFEQIDYYDFGWNAYGLAVIQGEKYAVCNHNSEHKIGGLVKDTRVIVQWGPEYTMMDTAMTKDSIFLVGTSILKKDDSTLNGGIIMELDHNYIVKNLSMYCGCGQFRGCMVIGEEDLTNNSNQLDSDSLDIKKRNDDNITVRIFRDKK